MLHFCLFVFDFAKKKIEKLSKIVSKSQEFKTKKSKKKKEKTQEEKTESKSKELNEEAKERTRHESNYYEHPSDYNLNNIGLSITIRDIYDEMGGDIRIILPVILAKRFKNYIGSNLGENDSSNRIGTGSSNNEHFSGNFVMRSSMKEIYDKYINVENSKLSTDILDETKTKVANLIVEWQKDDSLVEFVCLFV